MYVVVNDKNIYELVEQQPLIIENQKLPVKILAKNGFHFSKPLTITKDNSNIVLLGVGCKADNGRFWGGIILSLWLFMIFFITKFYIALILANLPLLYLMYHFFWKPKEFITIEILKK